MDRLPSLRRSLVPLPLDRQCLQVPPIPDDDRFPAPSGKSFKNDACREDRDANGTPVGINRSSPVEFCPSASLTQTQQRKPPSGCPKRSHRACSSGFTQGRHKPLGEREPNHFTKSRQPQRQHKITRFPDKPGRGQRSAQRLRARTPNLRQSSEQTKTAAAGL